MAPTPLRDRLEATFRFDGSDLAANRAGRPSARQVARLRAASGAARLVLAVFAVVTIGGALLFVRASAPGQLGLVLGIAAAIVVVGIASSWASLAALGRRTISVAEGRAEAVAEDRLRLGAASLVLGAPELVAAFEPGASYRVYYVAGPRALVLSAQALDEPAGPTPPEPADLARDPILALTRDARWIVLALGFLALQAPLAVLLAQDLLPRGSRPVVFAVLVAECVAFAVYSVRRLRSRS